MHRGYIKFWRCGFDDPMYLAEPFTKWQAWIDLIALANHKDGAIVVRGILVKVPRGYVAWSSESLAERWRWSRGKVERFLKLLKNDSKTVQQTVQQNKYLIRLIQVVNYDLYQSDSTASGATDGQQTDSRRYSNKNDKNDKKTITHSKFPTTISGIEEVEWADKINYKLLLEKHPTITDEELKGYVLEIIAWRERNKKPKEVTTNQVFNWIKIANKANVKDDDFYVAEMNKLGPHKFVRKYDVALTNKYLNQFMSG